MIDFEHIFPAENASIDENYLFGIDNLVKLFEELLTECIEWGYWNQNNQKYMNIQFKLKRFVFNMWI